MTDRLSLALAQINPTVGDLRHNAEFIRRARSQAAAEQADLILFPELVVCGYPPEDLVLKPAFLEAAQRTVEVLASETADGGPAMLVGAPWRQDGKAYNAVLLLDSGKVAAVRFKRDLPNYGVFDEKRVFTAGPLPEPIDFRGIRLGVPICEDIWTPDACAALAKSGADILLSPNASPFEVGKVERRLKLAASRVTETDLPLVYVNQIGGQDDLVFDGASFVMGADKTLRAQASAWREEVLLTHWTRGADSRWTCADAARTPTEEGLESIYQAMCVGLRDYVNKNHFPGVLLGLSGGIDSAISAAVAVDALGADRVHCVMLPSPYTSQESLDDAAEIARLLGCRLDSVSIEPAMAAFSQMMQPLFKDLPPDITEENIQSRARGLTLMALSNKFGHMVLTTGNKSEMAAGYATLYGDMCGGYSVLKDVYKTTVFALSRWRNQARPHGALGPEGRVMPDNVITRPPSAELRPNQTDQDTLPPYEALDDILECLIEYEMDVPSIVARGHAPELVQRVWKMLDRAEYKRRQSAPGVKLTTRAFGRERRYPITNGFWGQE